MPLADLGDVRIHYEQAGDGPRAFVYCHGLGQGGDGFAAEFDFWKAHFGRAVTWDNRGLGRSSPAKEYSLPLYAGDLARLLDFLGVQMAVLFGVSWGGIVVQQFALDYPGKCAALIIDSSSSEVNTAASERWYKQGEDARKGEAFGRPVKPDHLESFIASARAVAGLREHPLTPRLKQITCPVLVVGGAQDVVSGAAGSVVLARNLPKARLHIFQDAGHAVYSQKPQQFRALVLEFCRERGLLKA